MLLRACHLCRQKKYKFQMTDNKFWALRLRRRTNIFLYIKSVSGRMGLEVMEGETLVEEFRFKTVYNCTSHKIE